MMQNICPTHIKLLTVKANTLAAANALAEATFLSWSKDHPGVNICQVDRACLMDPSVTHTMVGELDRIEPATYYVTITIMYDLTEQFNAVAFLMRDLEIAVEAWRVWVKDGEQVDDHLSQTLIDMRIQLSQPFAALTRSFDSFRNW